MKMTAFKVDCLVKTFQLASKKTFRLHTGVIMSNRRNCNNVKKNIILINQKTHSHPFQVSLPTSRTLSHKSSFIPRTCNLWNILFFSCFPESYNLPSFKSKVNKLDLISLLLAILFLPLLGLCIGHHSLSST